MMETTSYSADKALAESLARLKSVEEDNTMLRSKLKQLTKDARLVERAESGGSERTKDSERLRKQNSEVSILIEGNNCQRNLDCSYWNFVVDICNYLW